MTSLAFVEISLDAKAANGGVHISGPDDLDMILTPKAAFETATHVGNAAIDALLIAVLPETITQLLGIEPVG